METVAVNENVGQSRSLVWIWQKRKNKGRLRSLFDVFLKEYVRFFCEKGVKSLEFQKNESVEYVFYL
jgi:hypothetical protein